jgi:hypothetical protein
MPTEVTPISHHSSFALAVPELDHCVSHEQVDDDEDRGRNNQRQHQGIVHLLPVGSDGREPPRAHIMKYDGTNNNQDQSQSHRHKPPLNVCVVVLTGMPPPACLTNYQPPAVCLQPFHPAIDIRGRHAEHSVADGRWPAPHFRKP